MVGIGIETRKMMRTQGRIRPVQTLSSTFSVFEASLVLERRWWQSVLIAFPPWKGDGCMKDTDHPIRHPRVHLAFEQLPEGEAVAHGETVSLAAEWHRVGLEGDPTFAHGSLAKVTRGSLQPTKRFVPVFCPGISPDSREIR